MLSKFFFIFIFLVGFIQIVEAEVYFNEERIWADGEDDLERVNEIVNETHFQKIGNTCYLKKPIHITENSTFRFDGTYCPELKMYPRSYIRIVGSVYFTDISVTSIDPDTGGPVINNREEYYLERPHIYTKYPAKYVLMENSEFAYLGYYDATPGSAWGVSFWGLQSGDVINSKFHNNYFGLYTFEAKNVNIIGSEIYDNIEYGLDFHDYSDNFVVKDNIVYNNGNHGIIFSKFCINNTVEGNYVFNHTKNAFVKGVEQEYGVHGIMLDRESNHNIIKNNKLENNRRAIYLFQSHDNEILDNTIINDVEDGIYIAESYDNTFIGNIAMDTGGYGLYSYYSYNNAFKSNFFKNGTYFKLTSGEEKYNVFNEERYVDTSLLQKPVKVIEELDLPIDITKSKVIFLGFLTLTSVTIITFEAIHRRKNGN